MQMHRSPIAILAALATVVLVTAFSSASTFAAPAETGAAIASVHASAEHRTSTVIAHYSRNEGAVGASTAANTQAAATQSLPALYPLGARYSKVKMNTARDTARGTAKSAAVAHGNSALTASFPGMQSSAAICPPLGCNPPDMALATSSRWIVQGVNTSYAVYDRQGALQPGWPKTFQDFFGTPSPGTCNGDMPFMSDPRTVWDANDHRFFAAALEVEGAFDVNNCPFKSIYWTAVSATGNPNGVWYIYAFEMALGTTNAADFTMIGFDSRNFYFSANMFNQSGTAYEYAEIFGANKALMESNSDVSAPGFSNLQVIGPQGTYVADTVQPVQTEAAGTGPSAGLFVDTLNGLDPLSGHTCTSAADSCQGLAVWAFRTSTSGQPTLSFGYASDTQPYYYAPPADQTTCTQCIDTSDLRISATPVYRNGAISTGWETGHDNGTQIVPAIEWAQVGVRLSDGVITGANTIDGNYFEIPGGDDAVMYPALMVNGDGTLYMVFDHSSHTTNPEVRLTTRETGGQFVSNGVLIKAAEGPYRPENCGVNITICRWGDYSATSLDSFTTNHVWFAGQYANAVSSFSRNWGTWIGNV